MSSKNAECRINSNTGECLFYLPPMTDIHEQTQVLISIQHASIPYSFYQINASNNNLTPVINGVTQTSIVIPPGNYSANQILVLFQTSMTQFNVSYSSTTNKFTFHLKQAGYEFSFHTLYSTCLEWLGFYYTFPQSSGGILVSARPVNLMPIQSICIFSNTLITGGFCKANMNKRNLLASIPIDVQPFQMISYKAVDSYKCNTYSKQLQSIDIQLCDQCGNLIDMNQSDWSITLHIQQFNFSV